MTTYTHPEAAQARLQYRRFLSDQITESTRQVITRNIARNRAICRQERRISKQTPPTLIPHKTPEPPSVPVTLKTPGTPTTPATAAPPRDPSKKISLAEALHNLRQPQEASRLAVHEPAAGPKP